MVSLRQTGFAGGIISAQLLGRSDQIKYATGLRACQNAWITRYGMFENRPGTVFCGEVKDSSSPLRIVPFIFSQDVSYLLEVGNGYFRPWLDGARIGTGTASAWSNLTTYDQGAFVTDGGSTYRSLAASNLNHQPSLSPTYWQVQTNGLVEVKDAIPQASLSSLQYVQQNDAMTLTQQGIVPQQFLRYSDSDWQTQAFTQSTGIAPPAGVSAIAGTPTNPPARVNGVNAVGGDGTAINDLYLVSAFFEAGAEGIESLSAAATNGRATAGSHVALTWTAGAGPPDGYAIYKYTGSGDVYGIIGLSNTNAFTDTGIVPGKPIKQQPGITAGSTTFIYEVTAVDAITGSESLASSQATCIGATPSDSHPNVITWSAVANALKYNVYRVVNSVPGFIGSVADPTLSLNDVNIIPDTSIQPPQPLSLFTTPNDYPAVVAYFQQRIVFANTISNPQGLKFSRVGNAYNFSVSTPIQDDDAISITIAGKQVQPVRALVDLGKLIIHTNNAEYVAQGNQFGAVTPTAAAVVATGSSGSSSVQPAVIGNTDIFIQSSGNRINDLRYEVQSFAYTGKDLTKFAPDLFKGRTIVDMAWQKLPHSIVWCVLDNGSLVGLTYTRDNSQDDVVAWHYHASTNGAFENVAVVPEGTSFAAYFVVRRTINGATKRYIEKLASRDCLDTVLYSDSYFCDSSQTYDGRDWISQAVPTTVTATTGGGWTTSDSITLTAGDARFVSGDVDNAVVMQVIDQATGLVTDYITFTITSYLSPTVVIGAPQRNVPTWARTTAISHWGLAKDTFAGISHLEGQGLSILADGNVVADPLDAGYPPITVSGGAFTIPTPALVVVAGLPIDMQGQTLPAENAQGETIINKRVNVKECCPIFYNSRGGLFGQDINHLKQWKQPESQTLGYPVPPTTGPVRIPVQGSPQATGQIFFRLTNPVPFAMSAIVLTGEVGN